MAFPASASTVTPTPTGTGPNSPELSSDGKQHMPAIRDIGQAIALVKGLEGENKDRILKNTRIQEKLNSERPFQQTRLDADGLGWKSNFSTKPLSSLADKVVPRFTTAVKGMRYLTASKLPDRFPNADAKTEAFRREVTETCRGREGWDDFMADVAQENTLFGFNGVCCLDPYGWFPNFYRQDQFLVPSETKHTAKSAPLGCFKQRYLIHELFDIISDIEAAKLAGWDTNEVINSINNAVEVNLRSTNSDPMRIYADLARQSAIATSFIGTKAVDVWHVFIAEVDGKITHVAYDMKSEKQLFWKEKEYERMSDIVSFYSLQHGNGKLQGSKGIGRELYNMAAILDRSRNEVVDRLQLSGKLVLQCDEKDIKRFRMSVIGNAILITSGYTIAQQKIEGNVEPFFQLDNFLTNLLDQIAGSTSPKPNEGERVTKAAIEINAAREEERRDTLIGRFLSQFARMMSMLQRRMCDPNTIENDALEMQKRLLNVMSREELDYLRNQPAVSTVEDYSDQERQQIVVIASEAKGNPLYNALELERRKLTALVDAEFAKAVLLPQNDPTEQSENQRTQLLELSLIKAGQDAPVSPRDNHIVHIQTCMDEVKNHMQAATEDPSTWAYFGAIGDHVQAHLQTAEQMGLGPQVSGAKAWLAKLDSTLQSLMQHQKEVTQQQAEAAALEPQPQAAPEGEAAPAKPTVAGIKETITINYKDFPPSIKRQVEASLGFTPAPAGELPEAPRPAVDPNKVLENNAPETE